MRLNSLYWKITIPFVLIVMVGMGILGYYTVYTTRNAQLNELRSYLIDEAMLVADASQSDFISSNESSLDALAKTIGQQITARITFIYRDGLVAGDSWENPATLENHANRPEVIQALASGVGVSTRHSTTSGETMMYAAVPVFSNGEAIGVARVALSTTAVEATVGQATQTIIITSLAVALLIVLLTAFVTRHITLPLSRISLGTEAVARGDLSQKVFIDTNDELGKLGRAFNDMASRLSHTTTLANTEKHRLGVVLNNMADGIILIGSDSRVLLANPVAEQLFSFSLKESRGRSIIEVVHDHEVDALYKKCLASGNEETSEVENGNHYIRVIVSPLPSDQPGGALLLLQDLTQLRTFQTMRQEFVANVSHELRTPLAGIKAIVEILHDGALEDKNVAVDFLNRVDIEVDKLTQMVNELMELSRIETGRVKLELKPTDINLLLQEAVKRFAPQAERQKLAITAQLEPELPRVQADSPRLMQVINNILHNAIKFTPIGGRITVSSHLEKRHIIVSITDTGIGISEPDLLHIFERFYKADRSRASIGTGLGLAIAKHIVQAHEGQIWAESQPGKGTTFNFSLPLSGEI